MGPKGEKGDPRGLPVSLFKLKILLQHIVFLSFLIPFFHSCQGLPGPPGPPGRPGIFNCPKGVRVLLLFVLRFRLDLNFTSHVLTFLVLWSLKTVFPIPPRPHCKMPVSDRKSSTQPQHVSVQTLANETTSALHPAVHNQQHDQSEPPLSTIVSPPSL